MNTVTPFPSQPKKRPQARGGDGWKSPRGLVLIVHACTIAAFAFNMLLAPPYTYLGLAFGIAALGIAANNRFGGMPWAATHHEFALRTVLIGMAILILIQFVNYIPPARTAVFFVWAGVGIWVIARALSGLVRAVMRWPFKNARSLFI